MVLRDLWEACHAFRFFQFSESHGHCWDDKSQAISLLLLCGFIPGGFFWGYACAQHAVFAACFMVFVIIIVYASFCRVAKVDFAFQSYTWSQNMVEIFICGPCVVVFAFPWAFSYQIADRTNYSYFPQIISYVAVLTAATLALTVGTRTLFMNGGVVALLRWLAPRVAGSGSTPDYAPWLGLMLAGFFFVPGFVRYRHDQALLTMVPLVLGTASTAGNYLGSRGHHAAVLLLSSCTLVYLQILLLRRRRVLPPALQGCKFVTLAYLRKVAASREGIRRCQDLPESAFGDPTKARYLVIVSHRWMDRYNCDVRTEEFPEGLRLSTMVKRFDHFFSISGVGRGRTLREKRWRCNFAFTSGSDVLVFFDFMSLPQIGQAPDGSVVERTPMETLLFQECLPSMGVLYSMFPVMVCDEVFEGAPAYLESGWCFSESATAWLGRQLNPFSTGSPVEKLLNRRSAALANLSEVGHDLDLLLLSKRFLFESDRSIARIMSGGFVLKSRLSDAIKSKNVSDLNASIRDIRAGRFESLLDQPLDSYLNTPLHAAVAANFVEGVARLLDAGANKNLKNLRGDTAVQLFLFPRLSKSARLCRKHQGKSSKLPPGDSFQRLSRQYTWSTLGPPATHFSSDMELDLDEYSKRSEMGALDDDIFAPSPKRSSIVSLDTDGGSGDDDDETLQSRAITPITEDFGIRIAPIDSNPDGSAEPDSPMMEEHSIFASSSSSSSESPSSCN